MSAPVLQLEDVTKAYVAPDGAARPVLDVRSFRLEAGEQVAMFGASGSGKTTFLHVVAGLVTPDAGRVVVCGGDLAGMSEAERDRHRAAHVGYVFQTFELLPAFSALENVVLGMAFGPGPDEARARHLLERLGLGDRLDDRPRALSIGQRQRVAVARALAARPSLVLADEPTGNLDPERAAEALGLLREVCDEEGASLLLVSHDRAAIESFDRKVDLGALGAVDAAAEGEA